MKKKLLIIAATLAMAFVLFLIVAAMQPGDYAVARSVTIQAPVASVFPRVNDLHKFQDWSPWAKVDPNCKYTYAGPATGEGSSFAWEGNAAVGAGKMTIVETKPNDTVRARLDFLKPFAGIGQATYTFKADNDKTTTVTWTMTGQKILITKAIGLFVSMDKMLGPQFEAGLATLKAISESAK